MTSSCDPLLHVGRRRVRAAMELPRSAYALDRETIAAYGAILGFFGLGLAVLFVEGAHARHAATWCIPYTATQTLKSIQRPTGSTSQRSTRAQPHGEWAAPPNLHHLCVGCQIRCIYRHRPSTYLSMYTVICIIVSCCCLWISMCYCETMGCMCGVSAGVRVDRVFPVFSDHGTVAL